MRFASFSRFFHLPSSSLFPLSARRGHGDEFKLIPSLALKEEYNDNIFFTEKARADDFITTVTPGLELIDRTEKVDVNLVARAHVLRYVNNTGLDNVDQNYLGDSVIHLIQNGSFRGRHPT